MRGVAPEGRAQGGAGLHSGQGQVATCSRAPRLLVDPASWASLVVLLQALTVGPLDLSQRSASARAQVLGRALVPSLLMKDSSCVPFSALLEPTLSVGGRLGGGWRGQLVLIPSHLGLYTLGL